MASFDEEEYLATGITKTEEKAKSDQQKTLGITKMAEKTFDHVNEYLEEGEQLRAKGSFSKALASYKKALKLAIKLDGERTPDIAHIKNEYADTLYQSGDYTHAEREVRHALQIIEDVIDETEGDEKYFILLRSVSLLGTLQREQGF